MLHKIDTVMQKKKLYNLINKKLYNYIIMSSPTVVSTSSSKKSPNLVTLVILAIITSEGLKK